VGVQNGGQVDFNGSSSGGYRLGGGRILDQNGDISKLFWDGNSVLILYYS